GPLVALAAARVRSSRRHAGGRAAVTVGAFTGRGAPHRVAAGGAAAPLRIRPARAVPMMGHATSNRSPADSHMPRATAMVMVDAVRAGRKTVNTMAVSITTTDRLTHVAMARSAPASTQTRSSAYTT